MTRHRVLDLVGLTLDDARIVWRENGVRDEDVNLVESAPPLRPPRRENRNVPAKRKAKEITKPLRPAPHFGELRVLRVVNDESKIELLLAREELKPQS